MARPYLCTPDPGEICVVKGRRSDLISQECLEGFGKLDIVGYPQHICMLCLDCAGTPMGGISKQRGCCCIRPGSFAAACRTSPAPSVTLELRTAVLSCPPEWHVCPKSAEAGVLYTAMEHKRRDDDLRCQKRRIFVRLLFVS